MDWTVASAQVAFQDGRLQAWIEGYLQVEQWANPGLLRRVQQFSQEWPEPELEPIKDIALIAGPDPNCKFPQDPQQWESEVQEIVGRGMIADNVPPIIGWRREVGTLNVADGNHRIVAAQRAGLTHLWALIHTTPLGATTPFGDTRSETAPSNTEPTC